MPPLISPHLPSSLETECSYPINRQRAATLKIDMAHLEYYAPACRPKYHLCQCAPKAQPRPCALPAQQLSRRQPTTNGQLTVSGPLILVARPGSTWSATEARERAAASSGWHLGDGVGEAVTMCEGRRARNEWQVEAKRARSYFCVLATRAFHISIPTFPCWQHGHVHGMPYLGLHALRLRQMAVEDADFSDCTRQEEDLQQTQVQCASRMRSSQHLAFGTQHGRRTPLWSQPRDNPSRSLPPIILPEPSQSACVTHGCM